MMLPTDLNINDKIKVMYRQMKINQKFVCNPLKKTCFSGHPKLLN